MLISFAIDQPPDDRRDQERLLHLSSLKGTDDYRREVLDEGATFLDLLIDYPSLQPPLEEVLDKLPPQQPRYYSHVTSPLASSTSLRFAFSLVRWRSPIKGRDRRGLCTDWLYRLSVGRGFVAPLEGEEERAALDREAEAERKALEREGYEATKDDSEGVPVFARPTRVRDSFSSPPPLSKARGLRAQTRCVVAQDFVVPDVGASVIMVGAGTGVSPFLGFVQHRYTKRSSIDRAAPTHSSVDCAIVFPGNSWWRGRRIVARTIGGSSSGAGTRRRTSSTGRTWKAA